MRSDFVQTRKGGRTRIAVGLAAVAVVAGTILAGGVTAPAARAATGNGRPPGNGRRPGNTRSPGERAAAAKPASVPAGIRSPYTTYSTAHDLIALGRDAMKNKTFAAIVATRAYQVGSTSTHRAHTWKNLDPLLGKVPGAAGIKTGFTSAAGQCLLFEAGRGSKTLIGWSSTRPGTTRPASPPPPPTR